MLESQISVLEIIVNPHSIMLWSQIIKSSKWTKRSQKWDNRQARNEIVVGSTKKGYIVLDADATRGQQAKERWKHGTESGNSKPKICGHLETRKRKKQE